MSLPEDLLPSKTEEASRIIIIPDASSVLSITEPSVFSGGHSVYYPSGTFGNVPHQSKMIFRSPNELQSFFHNL